MAPNLQLITDTIIRIPSFAGGIAEKETMTNSVAQYSRQAALFHTFIQRVESKGMPVILSAWFVPEGLG